MIAGQERGARDIGLLNGAGEGRLEHVDALGDQAGVPQAAVLFGEGHEAAVGAGPCRAPCVLKQHERKQARHLLVVDLGRQLASEPDRFGGEVDVAGVALVEDQVEHAQHRGDVTGLVEPDARDGPLGLLIRWAMVASGTR